MNDTNEPRRYFQGPGPAPQFEGNADPEAEAEAFAQTQRDGLRNEAAVLVSPEHAARLALVPTSIRVARQVVDGNWTPTGHDALMFAKAIVAMADAAYDRQMEEDAKGIDVGDVGPVPQPRDGSRIAE